MKICNVFKLFIGQRPLFDGFIEDVLVLDFQMIGKSYNLDLILELCVVSEVLGDENPSFGIDKAFIPLPVDAEHEFSDCGFKVESTFCRDCSQLKPDRKGIDLDRLIGQRCDEGIFPVFLFDSHPEFLGNLDPAAPVELG